MADKYIVTINMVLTVKDWEFVFPMSAERRECADFVREWVKFVRNPGVRVFDFSDVVRVTLHGIFSGGDVLRDGVEATTSAIAKVEKISPPEERSFTAWLKSWLFWPKKIDQMYRLTTENGSMFTVCSGDASVETRNQLWTSRFGAPDEMHYRGSLA
ncbi:hypothetical protein IJG11_02350 [Candidatus Saccharibacteria bacterium]|nr:hypothetical protein [Candidatus Saccharibacteria bacterium]